MDHPSAVAMYVMPCLAASDVARLRGASSHGIVAFEESIALGTAAAATSADPSATPSNWYRWIPLAVRGLLGAATRSVTAETVCLGWNSVADANRLIQGCGPVSVVCSSRCRGLPMGPLDAMPSRFLSGSKVVTVDLTGLDQLTTLPNEFLSETPSLRSVVLPSSITTIGPFFACKSGIEHVNLRNLPQLASIGAHFLSETPALRSVALPSSLMTIGPFFAANSGIEHVDLWNLPLVTSIGDHFLSSSLVVHVNLSDLEQLTTVDDEFLTEAKWLRTIALPPSTTAIGRFFACNSGITHVDFRDLPLLMSIGDHFLSKSRVDTVNLDGLDQLTTLPDGFLCDTPSLRSIALPPSTTAIGRFFASKSGIGHVDFRDLPLLMSIGDHFLAKSSVDTINLDGLHQLTTVGTYCLADTRCLRSVVFPPSIRSIGHHFCDGSSINPVALTALMSDVQAFRSTRAHESL